MSKVRKSHCNLMTDAGERSRDGWKQYPRPQMRRDGYLILGDNWTLNRQQIRMPFPPQSILSEYGKKVGTHLIYETTFKIPDRFTKERILLHFGAVDQIAEVFVNDISVGRHAGGYLSFSMDITEAINREEENHLTVKLLIGFQGGIRTESSARSVVVCGIHL